MHRYRLTWIAIFSIIILMFLRLPLMVAKEDSVLNTYRALVEVDALARQHYVERIDDDRLVDGAIRGMMFQLDHYSGYIAPDELLQYERRHDGDYIGVGIEVGMPGEDATVIAAIEGGPAAVAGVLAGDRILEINGRDVEGLSAFDMEQLLDGEPDTALRLKVMHAGALEPTKLIIRRGPVSITSVYGCRRNPAGRWDYLIDPDYGIGYIRVSNFQSNTIRYFDAALSELSKARVRGLVIDLRFNPGGVVDQATEMVDRFLDSGVIISTVTRRRAVRVYTATPDASYYDRGASSATPRTEALASGDRVEVVILVNGGTASAAEIVAGSMQDRGRGHVIGERSFGKGSVQRVIHLTTHPAAVKVTVAYYRLPGGRIIHRTANNLHTDSWGIKPDIEVVLSDEEVQAIQRSRESLDGGVSAGSPSIVRRDTRDGVASGARTGGSATGVAVRDRQLNAALAHLRERLSSTAAVGR